MSAQLGVVYWNTSLPGRYRGITAKQTPVTAVTAGFQENVIPIPRDYAVPAPVQHSTSDSVPKQTRHNYHRLTPFPRNLLRITFKVRFNCKQIESSSKCIIQNTWTELLLMWKQIMGEHIQKTPLLTSQLRQAYLELCRVFVCLASVSVNGTGRDDISGTVTFCNNSTYTQ